MMECFGIFLVHSYQSKGYMLSFSQITFIRKDNISPSDAIINCVNVWMFHGSSKVFKWQLFSQLQTSSGYREGFNRKWKFWSSFGFLSFLQLKPSL